ncbi:hypothetical protein HY041_01180, partial [Candidatus Roizmanbacteria bacterium]|nr:hypothetical protein [Candidatus Roizmanbacteria bacterium]
MRIAIDGGAICSNRLDQFGNYNFTKNLILGLSQFDKKNQYSFYSFCQEPDWFPKRKNIRYVKLWPTIFWLKGRISFEEIRKRNDVIFALNQAIPLITPSTIVSFSHGLSFRFFPQYYLDSHQILSQQLDEMMKRSSKIIVTSQRVKDELISISSAV